MTLQNNIAFHQKHLQASGTKQTGTHKVHCHPSGVAEPSHADDLITRRLKDMLSQLDVKLLDHFIVASNQLLSFAERGLI